MRRSIYLAAIAAITIAGAGCAVAPAGGMSDFSTRYRVEMAALTAARQAAALGVAGGTLKPDAARKVLDSTDAAGAALLLARVVQAPAANPGLDALEQSAADARSALVSALGPP